MANENYELREAILGTLNGEQEEFPFRWNQQDVAKIIGKPYRERLIIAGAFIAAELDRLAATETPPL